MSRYQCGQIWLVNFEPSIGHEYRKVRPGLVIQSDRYAASGKLLTILPLSSRLNKQAEPDILIRKDPKNRLASDSLIKTRQISSFDKRRFIKLIGTVDSSVLQIVEKKIDGLLF